MNWLERAQREISKMAHQSTAVKSRENSVYPRRRTAITAERNLTAVTAAPRWEICEKSGSAIDRKKPKPGLIAALASVRKDPVVFFRFEGVAHPGKESEAVHGQLLALLARISKAEVRLSVEDDHLCLWATTLPSLALIDDLEAARAALINAFRLAGLAERWQWGMKGSAESPLYSHKHAIRLSPPGDQGQA
jgi:hypothetical protein